MIRYDAFSHEATFELAAASVGPVHLLVGPDDAHMSRVPMRWSDTCWVARLSLAPGFYCYGFEVNGAWRRDRGVCSVRTQSGRRCSFAVVPVPRGV